MDLKELTDQLRAFQPRNYNWTFALYHAQKSKDGVCLNWNRCAMEGIGEWAEEHRRLLLEKKLQEACVTEYSPLLQPKEEIGFLETGNELIREQMHGILNAIPNADQHAPEDFANGVVNKPHGYVFYGKPGKKALDANPEATDVLLWRRANPFIPWSKTLLCAGINGTVKESENPILQFKPQTDFLMIAGHCFFLSEAVSKDLDLESRAAAVCDKRLSQLEEADILSNYEMMQLTAIGTKHTRKFLDFNREVLEHVKSLSISGRADFLSPFGISLDPAGKLDCFDEETCALIIDLFCGRVCIDVLGRLSTGKEIRVLE
ncbi:MAG: hypothetical protein LBR73_03910 [Oscillospiraceae bacterium]|nr:hypothetical protein [Oscillospiraceae bacterium]